MRKGDDVIMIQSAHINTDPGNNYLIAGQIKTPKKPSQMKEKSTGNLTEVLNINLEETHSLYNKDRVNFSEIKSGEKVPGTSVKKDTDNNIVTSDMALTTSAAAGTLPSPQAEALKTINIIYTNDLHGSFLPKENKDSSTGGIAYTASVIRDLKTNRKGTHFTGWRGLVTGKL